MAKKHFFKNDKPILVQDIPMFIATLEPISTKDVCRLLGVSHKDISSWDTADASEVSTNRPLNILLRVLDKNDWMIKAIREPTFMRLHERIIQHYPDITVYDLAEILGSDHQNGGRWRSDDSIRVKPTIQRNIVALYDIEERLGKKGVESYITVACTDAAIAGKYLKVKT